MMKMNPILSFVATILIGTINCQLRPITMHYCDDGAPLECLMPDCVDTAGCSLPQCCGATTGPDSFLAFTCTYPAKVNAQSANFTSYLTGVALTTTANDPFSQVIQMPLLLPTPTLLAPFNTDLCTTNTGFCPQNTGQNYTFTQGTVVPLPVTSASVVAEFKIVIINGSNTLLCVKAYARLLSPLVAGLAKLLPLPPLSIVG